jgi:outer membrane protein TolC
MKIKIIIWLFLVMTSFSASAQEKIKMSLREAVEIAISKSNEAILANTKIETSKLELATVKNNVYPNLRLSGQYLQLTSANLEGGLLGNGNPNSRKADVNSLLLGQANLILPLFQGFRLKNNIIISEDFLTSQTYATAHIKEQIALKVTELFARLYQANQTQKLFEENLKVSAQREKDNSNLVSNGLLAKNDLLKSQLQSANIQLALDNAKKNANITNNQLLILLQLPENKSIDIDIETVKSDTAKSQLQGFTGQRNDLEAMNFQQKAFENGIKLAKSNYYPSINLIGGYITFDLKNALRVTNAMNAGIGMSYDVTSLFKNNKIVKLAESKANQMKKSTAILSDKIKEEIFEANENYQLSVKQNTVYAQAVIQSAENYRIVKDKYNNSLSNTDDLLEADAQQLNAKINLALSEADLALRYYQSQFASGTLLNSLNLTSK